MITVAQATEKIIRRSRYLTEAMSKGLINTSALARYIRPEIESMLTKDVSDAAIIMAINRLSVSITKPPVFKNVFTSAPDITFRSNLLQFHIKNSPKLLQKLSLLHQNIQKNPQYFFTFTKGSYETTLVASIDLEKEIKTCLKQEIIESFYKNLSAISIQLPKEAIHTPAIYYFFLKSLAWEEVNIMEIISAHLELTIILEEKEVNKAFGILKSLFRD